MFGVLACPALADWDPGDPYKMHFPQLPDLENGMNVLATFPKVLADDFLCIETGPITDIHIWGSWLFDQFPISDNGLADPGAVSFHLSIHSDIPASQNPLGYSMPGELLWEHDFLPGEFSHRRWATSTEDFFDPNLNQIIGFDTQVIQYNFLIDPDGTNPDFKPFEQIEGTIYWLDVTAMPMGTDPDVLFGWKTSADHWNDDSVFTDIVSGDTLPWQELFDPRILPPNFQSLDQAFVITPEPGTMCVLIVGGIGALLRRRRG